MNIAFPKGPNSQRKELPFCYICGRQFSKASLPIHEPQCMKKWEIANEQLAPEFRKRKPVKPTEFADRPIGTSGKYGGSSDAAWNASQANLVPCPSCGRTFNMDRIEKHVSICQKSGIVPPRKTVSDDKSQSSVLSVNFEQPPQQKSPAHQKKSPGPVPSKNTTSSSSSSIQGLAKFCKSCGNKFEAQDKFCTECGTKRS